MSPCAPARVVDGPWTAYPALLGRGADGLVDSGAAVPRTLRERGVDFDAEPGTEGRTPTAATTGVW